MSFGWIIFKKQVNALCKSLILEAKLQTHRIIKPTQGLSLWHPILMAYDYVVFISPRIESTSRNHLLWTQLLSSNLKVPPVIFPKRFLHLLAEPRFSLSLRRNLASSWMFLLPCPRPGTLTGNPTLASKIKMAQHSSQGLRLWHRLAGSEHGFVKDSLGSLGHVNLTFICLSSLCWKVKVISTWISLRLLWH